VRVATFNINNINKRLDNLLAWLAKAEPDVVSLQELKAEQEAFPVNALRTLRYEAVWQGERSWNGVAILARNHVPVLTCTSLPGNPEDHQARYIEAAVQGVLITSIYLPNGNPQPGPKFNYKLAWFERLIAHAAELMANGAPVVLAGHCVETCHRINSPGTGHRNLPQGLTQGLWQLFCFLLLQSGTKWQWSSHAQCRGGV
jgi:exodeoxyribonuclease-3